MSKNSDPIGEALGAVFVGIGKGLKSAFYGIKRLTAPLPILGFVLSALVTFLAVKGQGFILSIETVRDMEIPVIIRYLVYWCLLLVPLFYLMILGRFIKRKGGRYDGIFEEIGFKGKNKSFPFLITKKEDGKKTIYVFRSNIPLKEWKKAKERLETGFDCNIRQILAGSNKRIVELVTVPSDFQIPELIHWDDEFIDPKDGVLVVGESDLQRVSFDLNRTPHVLAAGETGSGKSVLLRAMLWQMIKKSCQIFMIDFKGGVEFGKAYEKYGEVITDRERALVVLEELVKENEKRLRLFRELEVKNLKEYNQKTGSNLCRICVFADEIAEMLDKKGVPRKDREIYEQLEGALSTLARLSRATGINLILGAQRPDANVLTGQIKNNIPVRICGKFQDPVASEIVLGNTAAEDLPNIKGRFLYKSGNEMIEFQSYWFDDERDLQAVDVEPGEMLTGREPRFAKTARAYDHEKPPEGPSLNFDYEY